MSDSLFALEPYRAAVEWKVTDKGSSVLRRLADAHYTRQKPGSSQFCRPGVNLCLSLSDGTAGWIVWRPIPEVGRMDDLEAWECTLFRNEGESLSSVLIRAATEITFREWGWPPYDGLITAVGIQQTRRRRSKSSAPGKCFLEAGWEAFEKAGEGKVWLRAPHPIRTARPSSLLSQGRR